MFVELVEVGAVAIEHRRAITEFCQRWIYRIRHGQLHIAVFGPGGVGKTTLGKFLSGTLESLPDAYHESIGTETFVLEGNIPCLIAVPPGQDRRQPTTWPQLFRGLAAGASAGIINVVADGYHSFEGDIGFTEHRLYQSGMTVEQFRDVYLADRRDLELRTIRVMRPHIENVPERIWMITLVTKQDLWWDDRVAVQKRYELGDYSKEIEAILRARGANNFVHEYLSLSFFIQNLLTGKGELLAPTVAGYDQRLQIANLNKFAASLAQLF